MNIKRTILFRAGAIALLLLVAGVMFIIGRGHTVYLDNKTVEYNGQTYAAFYRTEISVDGEQVARLAGKERGMSICIGQKFTMALAITEVKGGDEAPTSITVRLPYNMDGIIINLPALLAGLPEDAYLSEFTAGTVEPEPEDKEIVLDEFALPEDLSDI